MDQEPAGAGIHQRTAVTKLLGPLTLQEMPDNKNTDKDCGSSGNDGAGTDSSESAGACLRKERISKGLSLEEVSLAVNIRPAVLRALEEDDSENLPAEAFVRGLISIYAKHLQLDPVKIQARQRSAKDGSTQQKNNNLDAGTKEKFNSLPITASATSSRLVILLGVLLLLCGVGYFAYTLFQPDGETVGGDLGGAASETETVVLERILPREDETAEQSIISQDLPK